MADIPDLDLSTLNQPTGLPVNPPQPVPAAPVREVVAPLHTFQEPLLATAAPIAVLVPQPPVAAHVVTPRPMVQPTSVAAVAPIMEETIEIAPNPTTNRFPWTPVANPRVQVMAPAMEIPEAPLAAPQPPPNLSQPVPVPIPEPTPTPPPIPQPQPIPEVVPVVAPVLEPVVVPAVEPEPIPIAPPPPTELPQPPASPPPMPPPQPAPRPVVAPVEPLAVPQAEEAPQPIPEAAPKPHPHSGKHPVRIYSDYTREVWHVFRPNKLLKVMLICFVLALIGGAIAIWWISGAPTDFYNLPFLKSILHAE